MIEIFFFGFFDGSDDPLAGALSELQAVSKTIALKLTIPAERMVRALGRKNDIVHLHK
jgi:hypothetical protein